MKIRLYQIDIDRDTNGVAFEAYERLDELQENPNIDSGIYNCVYEGSLSSESNLEDVYRTFNIDCPDDYEGRSMSVSDVVEVLESDAVEPGFYYCDSVGFQKVDFDPDMTQKMFENKITVIMVEPGKEAYITSIGSRLEDMQQAVGGCIEAYYPFEEEVCIVCNDEGKINGSAPSRAVYDENGEICDVLFGKFFICDCSGENFGSLNEEQCNRFLEKFRLPEKIYKFDGKIEAVKYKPETSREER